jgi:hypothetical protein
MSARNSSRLHTKTSSYIYFILSIFLAEIAEDDLDLDTQQAIKEQTERDKRI